MPKAKVNGISIEYDVCGHGEPLVLIMGFGGSKWAWFFQRRAFRKHFRVITFDNRGAGRSDKPTEPYTMRTLADDVVGLMDYLKIDKAHVMGLSMGGMIAQHVAITYPERVGKLILASTLPRALRDGGGGFAPEIAKALGFAGGYTEEDARSVPADKTFGAVVAFAFNRPLYRIPAIIASRVYPKLIDRQGVAGQHDAIMGHNTLDALHTIKAPTLVIAGARDRIISSHASEEMASRIPNARLVLIEGGSHAALLESRVRFNREVQDFLRG